MTSQLTPEQIAEQSNEPKYRYGDNVLWFLNELASWNSYDVFSDDFEVYGENEDGIEASASVSIVELAADAARLITALQTRAESAEQALLSEKERGNDMLRQARSFREAHDSSSEIIRRMEHARPSVTLPTTRLWAGKVPCFAEDEIIAMLTVASISLQKGDE